MINKMSNGESREIDTEFQIREVKEEDFEKGLLEVYIEGYRYHHEGRPDVFIELTEEEYRKDLNRIIEKMLILVIVDDGNVVGYLSYVIKKGHTNKLNVDQLVIKKDYRGKGLGRMLMDEVKNIAIKNNCQRIELNCWLFNTNALEMYEHIGFDKQRIIYEMKL